MKKILSIILPVVIILSVVCIKPFQIKAETKIYDDFEYCLWKDGKAEITGYIGSDTKIAFPNEIDGHAVFFISPKKGFDNIKSVILPDNFADYNNFVSLTSLTEINVSDNNSWLSSANGALLSKDKTELRFCPKGKTSYNIPDSVTSIDMHAFSACYSLKSVTIPNSVTTINWYAFFDCTSLKSIDIPDNVTNIGDHALGYYDFDGHEEKDNDFIIYGKKGSIAEIYANKNGFTFKENTNNSFVIILICVAIIALLIALIVVVSKKNKKKKNETNSNYQNESYDNNINAIIQKTHRNP